MCLPSALINRALLVFLCLRVFSWCYWKSFSLCSGCRRSYLIFFRVALRCFVTVRPANAT
ncbi:hypothetical protein E2C01_040459 [Portunus trituberculatus]|uniref:Uncharacterized protein n=1 Tax=Portunus trituberculatus TaxID=210409 RepID=A0A5B7FNU6_PORTR|nr:hypothetical protein [Portunus trituberculatus]